MARGPLSLAVVGADYPNKRGPTRHFAIALCKPGDPIELRREPKNPKDERAVAVFNPGGIQMGYISAERAAWIAPMLDRGRVIKAIFQERMEYGAAIRIAFDGDDPVLPERENRENHTDDPDFYPDPIYPDD